MEVAVLACTIVDSLAQWWRGLVGTCGSAPEPMPPRGRGYDDRTPAERITPVHITRLNPERLHEPSGYTHATIVDGGRLVFFAGQCPVDLDNHVVGRGDVLAQVDQVVANAHEALAAAGAAHPRTSCGRWSTS